MGPPVGVGLPPDIDVLQPDRVAIIPDMVGPPIIIDAIEPAHIFVAVPEMPLQ